MKQIKIFCPATIANLSCGFDVLGVCLDTIGDEMIITKTDEKRLVISKISGANLPLQIDQNVAGVAATAMLNEWITDFGFSIEIHKKIATGSGIGSSAASAAGAVFGINELLGRPFSSEELVHFAMQGEKLASGSAHADNVAPALLGGFTLIRSSTSLDIVRIESPADIFAVILHPSIEIKTADARAMLPKKIKLTDAITQWGNLAGLIAGLYTSNYGLINRSLTDVVIEPHRSLLIPGFDAVRNAAMYHGALGAGISGSGPSIFALTKGFEKAQQVAAAMAEVYEKLKLPFQMHVSPINSEGMKIIEAI